VFVAPSSIRHGAGSIRWPCPKLGSYDGPSSLSGTEQKRNIMNNVGSLAPLRARGLLRAFALVAVLALGATACSSGDKSDTTSSPKLAAAALAAGLKAHAANDLATAAADYRKTLMYDPTNKYAFYNLALIDSANGNYGLAQQDYRSALKTDPAYEPALFNLAILRTASKDPVEAMSLYKKVLAGDATDASAWLNLGLLQRVNGQVRAGNRAVLKAIALNPALKDPSKTTDDTGTSTP
jgi:Tfp pilus assembly protein PilF